MSKITHIAIQHIFPKCYGEYTVDFSQDDEKTIAQYTDPEFIKSNNPDVDTRQNFQILYNGTNILEKTPAFTNLRNTCLNAVHHFIGEVLQLDTPEGCQFYVSDSWIVKVSGLDHSEVIRPHSHAFSFLTGILYLDASDNGLYIKSTQFADDYLPFFWPRKETNFFNTDSEYIKPERGKLILFSSKLQHEIKISDNNKDTRHSLAFNIFPSGIVSTSASQRLVI